MLITAKASFMTKYISTLDDFRSVTLTSLVMKCLEKLVKTVIMQRTYSSLEPLQFAYRAEQGVEYI